MISFFSATWTITTYTATHYAAGTDAKVFINLKSHPTGETGPLALVNSQDNRDPFESGR